MVRIGLWLLGLGVFGSGPASGSDLNLSVFGCSGSWGSWFLVFDLGVMGHGSSGDGRDTKQAAQPIVKFWRVITTSEP